MPIYFLRSNNFCVICVVELTCQGNSKTEFLYFHELRVNKQHKWDFETGPDGPESFYTILSYQYLLISAIFLLHQLRRWRILDNLRFRS